MSLCAARAAASAAAGSIPSRVISTLATAADAGTTSVTTRQRDLIVGTRSSADGAHSSQTVRRVGLDRLRRHVALLGAPVGDLPLRGESLDLIVTALGFPQSGQL